MTEPRLVAYCRPEDEQRARRYLGDNHAELRTSDLVPRGKVIVVDEAMLDEPLPFPHPLRLR